MSKHLNDLSAVYLNSIAEENKCNATPIVEEECGCDHAPKQRRQALKYRQGQINDLQGKEDEGKQLSKAEKAKLKLAQASKKAWSEETEQLDEVSPSLMKAGEKFAKEPKMDFKAKNTSAKPGDTDADKLARAQRTMKKLKGVKEEYKDFPSDKVDRQALSKLKKGQEKFAKDKDLSAAKKVLGQAKTMRAVQLAQNRVSGARVGMGNTAKSANPQASKAVARTLTKQKDKDREKQADTNLDGHYANQGGRFAAEGKQPIHIGRMLSQASNKDYQASKEKNPSKREKLETQARTIRTTVDMDSFKKRTSKIKPQRAGVQEGFSNWRQDLIEVSDGNFDVPSSQAQKDTEMKQPIKDKKVKNKVLINPPMAVSEAVEALGGTILEFYELDENRAAARSVGGYKDDSKKQTDPSKPGFTGISGSIKDIMRQNREIEARKKAETKKEETVVERTLDKAEKKEKERIVKGMKKSMPELKKRYGDDAKSVMYATATKRAKEKLDTSKSDYRYGVEESRDPAKEAEGKKIASYEKTGRAFGLIKKFRQENPGSRQPKKVRGAKETEGQAAARRRGAQAQRAAKYGLTSKEKKETQARAPYYSTRD